MNKEIITQLQTNMLNYTKINLSRSKLTTLRLQNYCMQGWK